jgi:phosphoketolase
LAQLLAHFCRFRRRAPSFVGRKNVNEVLKPEVLQQLDAYWRAANYLSVGQIYLYANPLLRQPLKREHIKPRLLGHWGSTPGLNFIYAYMNRLITEHDLNATYIAGPGHGGAATGQIQSDGKIPVPIWPAASRP